MPKTPKNHICKHGACTNLAPVGYKGYCVKHAYYTGAIQKKVPATKARQRIQQLIDEGHSFNAIADMTGVTRHTIKSIWTAEFPTCRRRVYDQIMHPDPTARRDRSTEPAWPVQRRIRALRAAGWSIQDIAAGAGVSVAGLYKIARPETQRVEVGFANKVKALYTQHECDPLKVPASTAIGWKMWPKPMDWNNIDDPNEDARASEWNPRITVRKQHQVKAARVLDHYKTKTAAAEATDTHTTFFSWLIDATPGKSTAMREHVIKLMEHQL